MLFSVTTACLAFASVQTADPRWTLQDVFGRDVAEHGVTLVDWEGYLANPAIKLRIVPSERLYAPAKVTVTADGGRLMFDLYSEFGPRGPSKVLFIESSSEPVEFWMSIAPDRDFEDEEYTLKVEVRDANMLKMTQTVPVRVIDQDRERGLDFNVMKDFSYDETGFFDSEEIKMISRQAADDWAYFFADQGFDPVEAGSEKSWIWEPSGFVTGRDVTNSEAYTGFKLYFHGINHEEGRAGAEASRNGEEQTRDGVKTGLRRSGTVMMDTTGNYNHLGWTINLDDDLWHKTKNMSYELHDYYSIVQHEMRHSFVYHRVHRAFDEKLDGLTFIDYGVRTYLGYDPDLLAVEHFGGIIDPVSKFGVMGNEYNGEMPRARWMLTKFDILIAQAVGYRLRETTPFVPVRSKTEEAYFKQSAGTGVEYALPVTGGVPSYDFVVASGSLPPGIELDRWTGVVSGTPTTVGHYRARIEISDNDPTTGPATVEIVVDVTGSVTEN